MFADPCAHHFAASHLKPRKPPPVQRPSWHRFMFRPLAPALRRTMSTYSTVATPNAPSAIGPCEPIHQADASTADRVGLADSQAIKTDSLIFLSGCIPLDPATMKVVDGGVEEQTVSSPVALALEDGRSCVG